MKKILLLILIVFAGLGTMQAQVTPQISEGETEYWYYIQFKQSGLFIQDMDADAKLQTKILALNESQLWKIISDGDDGVQVVNKESGRKIALVIGGPGYDGANRYGTSDSQAMNFKLIDVFARGVTGAPLAYELERLDSPNHECLNKKGNNDGAEVGEWTNTGNSWDNFLHFFTEDQLVPKISNNENDYWYAIQFNKNNYTISDMGDDALLEVKATHKNNDALLWKFVKVENDEIQVVNKESERKIALTVGGPEYNNSNRYGSSSTATANFNVKIRGAMLIELERIGSPNQECLNPRGEINGEIGEWTNSGNSADNYLKLVPEEELVDFREMPKISTEEDYYWYRISFNRNNTRVFVDMGNGENIEQKSINENDTSQLWKFVRVSDKDEFYIENKSGAKIVLDKPDDKGDGGGRRYQASSTETAEKFHFTNGNLLNTWAFERISGVGAGVQNNHIYMNDKKVDEETYEVCEYTKTDGGSALLFTFAKYEEGIETGTNVYSSNVEDRVKLILIDRELEVIGDDISSLTVYNLAGQIITSVLQTNIVGFYNPGVYILQISYANGVQNTVKVSIY